MTTCPRWPLMSGPKSGRLIQIWWSYYFNQQSYQGCRLIQDLNLDNNINKSSCYSITTIKRNIDFVFLETLINEINELVIPTKNLHHENLAKKLNNPLLQAKTYWSIIKTFYNKKHPTNSTSW